MEALCAIATLGISLAGFIMSIFAIRNRFKEAKENYEKPTTTIVAIVLLSIIGIIVMISSLLYGMSLVMAFLEAATSIFFTWGFPLSLATLIRYCGVKAPLGKIKSFLIAFVIYFIQMFLTTAINGVGAHPSLFAVAGVTFAILINSKKDNNATVEQVEYNECPECQRRIPKTEMYCKCGHKFDN